MAVGKSSIMRAASANSKSVAQEPVKNPVTKRRPVVKKETTVVSEVTSEQEKKCISVKDKMPVHLL